MVTAKAEVDLRLSDFQPRSMLVSPVHEIRRPKFPVIDYHNHLDALDPADVLRVIDECGIQRIVNITMRTGDAALRMIRKFHEADSDRFSTYGWMDWSDLHSAGFFKRSVDRLEELVEHGACGLKLWKDLPGELRRRPDADGTLLRVDDERLGPLFEKAARTACSHHVPYCRPGCSFFQPIDSHNERYEELAAHPEWSFHGSQFDKSELLGQRDKVFTRHPNTTFVGAHVAEHPEDLSYVSRLLDSHSNLYVDIGARCAELGRQPYTAREFFLKHSGQCRTTSAPVA